MNNTPTGNVVVSRLESGVALIQLGTEAAVTLTPQRLDSLKKALFDLKSSSPKGLIITGSSTDMFTVGADINLIRGVTDPAVGESLAREGQDIFNLIEELPFPTVAAISGPCVGGGCELALACKFRIISDEKSSIIGLPEVKLGILPGFGGTQRLPRLVGLPKALDIILAGKTLRPRQAQSVGLVNEVVQSSRLLERADSIASGSNPTRQINLSFFDKILTHSKLGRSFVKKKAKVTIQKESKGFYPAPPSALESCIIGLERGTAVGYRFEAKELGKLIVSPESKALVSLFFLSEGAKSIGRSARKQVENLTSVVIGAGTMGAGIAGALAKSGCSVTLKDKSDVALAKGKELISTSLQKLRYLSETEKSFILNRVETTSRDLSNPSSVQFVVEAVFEDLSLKQKILSEIASQISEDAVVATNTSSLSVSKIAQAIPNPSRVVGMHFFNPVEKMPLVEIVMAESTSDKTLATVAALTTKLGKYPIIVRDVPGFLVNRILVPYLNEAAFLLQEGYSIVDIDTAATKFGMPMGPFRLLDEVGLDVAAHVSEIMVSGYGERMKAPGFTKLLANHNRLGKKSGGGFYDYKDGKSSPSLAARDLLKLSNRQDRQVTDLSGIQQRLILALVNEAILCLDEGVAGEPGPEAAAQVNLGTVMGIGFPPFRGGVLYFADAVGLPTILENLQKLEKDFGSRYKVAPGLINRVTTGQKVCG
jgi:3-hydroxyacyl-CoA dehydrogenase/enoyl-CoA hydratase/3-hydroxybutyryl-CoA epimerase